MTAMCAAPEQTLDLPAGTDTVTQAVLQGRVLAGAEPVAGAHVRLLDGSGEFTAEVVASAEGSFRFYAGPGNWTVRALSRAGNGQSEVTTEYGVYSVDVLVSR
jgi:hypothetical protein